MSLTPSASTVSPYAIPSGEPTGRWAILSLLGVTQFLGMSLWFTASATAVQLTALWDLDPAMAAGLTMAVQVGFVAGTALAALLNLADLVPSRVYVAVAALLAAASNYGLILAGGLEPALASRFLTGFFLAGVYPPAMKMAATWFRASRGLAIGVIVGALTVGKAAPYLVGAFAELDYRFIVTTTSAGAVLAALLVVFGYRDGPFAFERRPFAWSLVGIILRHRPSRLAIGAYLGHMWELYACWAALSLFFLHFFIARGVADAQAMLYAGVITFAAIAAGGPGSVLAGVWADRWGREKVAGAAMAVSGACALTIGWLGAGPAASGVPAALVVGMALVWGLAVVADSAQFSALVTEVSPSHAVGTALTLQTSLGFLLTAFTIWLTFQLQHLYGWGVAFSVLAVGPAFGIWQLRLLLSER